MTFLRYGTAWLRYFLMCDSDARSYIDGAGEQGDLDAGTINSYAAERIGPPGGCAALDGGEPDAGTPAADGGGTAVDAGASLMADAGEVSEADAGGHSTVPVGCRCSGTAALAPAAALVLVGMLRRRRSARARW